MERNGDLNKAAEGPYGRLSQQKYWAELGEVLNMDITGEAKPVEKWKRVWSDLKHNTKEKAAKIHRAGSGTGGGPPTLVLSDLELRILSITGSRAATGLTNIEEVGAPPARPLPAPVRSPTPPTEPTPVPYMLHVDSYTRYKILPRLASEIPDTTPNTSPFPAHTSPPPPPTHTCPPSASRRPDFRPTSASQRSAPRTQRVDAVTRQFQANEERWRNLVRKLATEHLQLRRDDQQLRRLQLQVQAQWQALFARSLDLADNFMNSLGNQ